jgi:Fe-S-cluster containining protein
MDAYRRLLGRVDAWFARVLAEHPSKMQCRRGCFDCCLGLFDISIADAALLREGLAALAAPVREGIEARARALMEKVAAERPELRGARTLDALDEDEIDDLTDAVGPERCPCLGEGGECLVYDYRPMVCRLNGAPVVDVSGAVVHEEGCFKNSVTPGETPRLEYDVIRREERKLLRRLYRAGLRGVGRPEETALIAQAVLQR